VNDDKTALLVASLIATILHTTQSEIEREMFLGVLAGMGEAFPEVISIT
jgi:hypothetical protein